MTVSAAIVDLDGTIYRGDELLPGAEDAVRALRTRGIPTLFFSNNPTETGSGYVDRLEGFGLDVEGMEAVSAADVTVSHLRSEYPGRSVALVGSESLREILQAAGIDLVEDYADAEVLVVSWTPAFDYDDMAAVANRLSADATLLGTDPDRRIPTAGGAVKPGSGAIVHAIAGVLEREPDRVLGKPDPIARDLALERLGATPEETLVVGDNLDTDVAMGADAGMQTALVLSGNSDRAALAESAVDPDHVIETLAELDGLLRTTATES